MDGQQEEADSYTRHARPHATFAEHRGGRGQPMNGKGEQEVEEKQGSTDPICSPLTLNMRYHRHGQCANHDDCLCPCRSLTSKRHVGRLYNSWTLSRVKLRA